MIGRTRREIGAQTPTAHSDVFARSRSDLLGSRDLGCPRMEKVLRAPAAHGVSGIIYYSIPGLLCSTGKEGTFTSLAIAYYP